MTVQRSDGMNYAPQGKPNAVVKPGEFIFAAVSLDHGHIYGMCNGLTEAGATLKWVYDSDPKKVEAFLKVYPKTLVAPSEETILMDPEVQLVAGAAIPSTRCSLGLRVMDHGKDYFTDKTPFTTMEQLRQAREMVAKTGQKYMVYYSERLHVESAVFAGHLIQTGAIGKVVQVTGFGPHRLSAASRPDWFFKKETYGGILCDIGSHQIEQFLYYAGCEDAKVLHSKVGNYASKEYRARGLRGCESAWR
jgi:predicted dehydrogenase